MNKLGLESFKSDQYSEVKKTSVENKNLKPKGINLSKLWESIKHDNAWDQVEKEIEDFASTESLTKAYKVLKNKLNIDQEQRIDQEELDNFYTKKMSSIAEEQMEFIMRQVENEDPDFLEAFYCNRG